MSGYHKIDYSEQQEKRTPLVSVGMLVYNQEKYIGKAIESVLMQEVNFDYEIVIADDYSTDRTREIIIDYAKKYPQIIKLILQEKNVGMVINSKHLKLACCGKYRANLEGDDYWISTKRLQKQVDFLENNPEYVAVGGILISVNDEGRRCNFPWGDPGDTYVLEGDYTKKHFEDWKLPGHTSTWVSRNIFYYCDSATLEQYEEYKIAGDRKTPLFFLQFGKIYIFNEIFMARRILWNSQTSHMNTFRNICIPARSYRWILETERMDSELTHLGIDLSAVKDRMFLNAFRQLYLKRNMVQLKGCFEIIKLSDRKLHSLFLLFRKCCSKIHNKIKNLKAKKKKH
jgi:glycosyltransferase involved in cell wall biosynthesis